MGVTTTLVLIAALVLVTALVLVAAMIILTFKILKFKVFEVIAHKS